MQKVLYFEVKLPVNRVYILVLQQEYNKRLLLHACVRSRDELRCQFPTTTQLSTITEKSICWILSLSWEIDMTHFKIRSPSIGQNPKKIIPSPTL